MKVTVGVVTNESASLVPSLVESLGPALEGLDWQLVVADSGSTDGTRELVKELAPDATVIDLGGNLGYAAGVNACVAAAPGTDALLVLSHSTRLRPGSGRLLAAALGRAGVGIAVPRLVNGEGVRARSLRREPTPLRILGQGLLTDGIASRFAATSEMVTDPAAYERDTEADWATGAVLLVSGACLDRVGRWDESFFLYSEETDFCLRARDAGFRLVLVPTAEAVHLGGPSRRVPKLWALTAINKVRLHSKRHGVVSTALFWLASCLAEAARAPFPGQAIHRAALRRLLAEFPRVLRYDPTPVTA